MESLLKLITYNHFVSLLKNSLVVKLRDPSPSDVGQYCWTELDEKNLVCLFLFPVHYKKKKSFCDRGQIALVCLWFVFYILLLD